MLKNVEYKSIYMGIGVRYVVEATIMETGERRRRLLSLNESKFIPIFSNKEKYEYAERILCPITESKTRVLKMYDVVWTENKIKHHQRIKAVDERSATERVHSIGGSVISVQEVS